MKSKIPIDKERQLRNNDVIINIFAGELKRGDENLDDIPKILIKIINNNMWQRRMDQAGRLIEFDTFYKFVTDPPLSGLGEKNLDAIKRLCRDNPEAQLALAKVTIKPKHLHVTDSDNVTISNNRGNTRQYSLRRLEKGRPDLLKKVIDKELTANAAMIEAGFRKVPTPFQTIEKAWNKASNDDLLTFIREHKQQIQKLMKEL